MECPQYIWKEEALHFSSAIQSRPTLCDPMDCTPGFPVHHQHLGLVQIHVHGVVDAIQPCHRLWLLGSGGLRALDKLCVEPAGVSRRCMGVSVPLLCLWGPRGEGDAARLGGTDKPLGSWVPPLSHLKVHQTFPYHRATIEAPHLGFHSC